ncbi:MAG: TAXI family TRAP transporter solute-binding subunit [Nitrospinota bacterium]
MRRVAVVLAVIVGLALLAGPAAAQKRYKHATGPAGGNWFISMGGAVKVLNEANLGIRFDGVATRGSGENARLIGGTKDMHFGLSHISTLYNAWHGKGKAFKGKPARETLVLGKMLDQGQIFVTRQDTDIHKISDLVGKKVNLGPVGSGTELNSRNLLTALGLFDKVKRNYLNFAAFGRALANRQLDAVISASSPCTITAVTQASQRRPVRFLSLTQAEYEKIAAKFPFYGIQTCTRDKDPHLRDVKGFKGPVRSSATASTTSATTACPRM